MLSGMIFFLYLNSVGPPNVTPIVCAAHAPFILSLRLSFEILNYSFESIELKIKSIIVRIVGNKYFILKGI